MNIIKNNNTYRFYNATEIINELEMATYIYGEDKFGSYLEKVETSPFPEKIYSNDANFIEHVMFTWNTTKENVGILLQGLKGLGKSFTANILSQKVNLPIIKINNSLSKNSDIIGFLNGIGQDHVIYIDEFEKIFPIKNDSENDCLSQEAFLSYLDGSSASKYRKMFIITTNDAVNKFFINRPSRIRYVKNYVKLETNIIREIIEDKLINKDFLDDLIYNVDATTLNIDNLIKIIEEINVHNKPYSTFKDYFNYIMEEVRFEVIWENKGKKHFLKDIHLNYIKALKMNNNFSHNFGSVDEKNCSFYIYRKIGTPVKIDKEDNMKVAVTITQEFDSGKTAIKSEGVVFIKKVYQKIDYTF